MTVQLSPTPVQKFFDNNGNPLANGQLFTYIAGTTTPQATYVDSTQTTQNTNPIILNARGEAQAWLVVGQTYKVVLQDAFGNTIWTVDQIPGGYLTPATLASTLTQTYLGAILYPQTAAELAANVTPANIQYQPGDLRRYGADPLGVADSAPALQTAISCNDVVFDGYPGGGNYLINSAVILKSTLRISGAIKTNSGLLTAGTNFVIGTGAAHRALHATAFISDFEIERITFSFQNNTLGQTALYFDLDCRTSRIHDCLFQGGTPSASTNIAGIGFGGGGTFTGDVTIEKNYFNNLQVAVGLAGACSTVRILSNEMYTQPVIVNTTGVNNGSTVGGLVVAFNSFQAWNVGIFAPNGTTRQLYNYFEGSLTWDFNWATSTFNVEIGSISTGAPLSNFLYNNASNNIVLGLFGTNIDSSVMKAWRGFAEQSRTLANGHQGTRTFAAGNYTGSSSMTWTVTGGEVGADILIVNGNEATYYFEVTGATVGGTLSTALQINLASFGFTASNDSYGTCSVNDNAAGNAIGICRIINSTQLVQIYKDGTLSSNWSASTTSTTVRGYIKFPINFSVN